MAGMKLSGPKEIVAGCSYYAIITNCNPVNRNVIRLVGNTGKQAEGLETLEFSGGE